MSDTHTTFVSPEIDQLAPLFPGYDIQSLIATGGMGAVYLAIQKSLDRTVAIKILPHELSRDASFCAGFEAEAKAMARLNHPNLIGVFDFGEVEGMLYIIMEYVPGKSLFHSANGLAIDPSEVIRLVTGICSGLAHAHENGIIHRDIKPSNILLDLNAQPKIGDFGLARPVERKDQEGEEIFGTPHYTAPEVINSPQSVGFRADIFSVGVMLHELLTGRLPADDPRPASVIIHCDPRFDAIIRRASNPKPELRYASAADMAKDLHLISSSAGPRVLRTAAPPQVRPNSQVRHRSSVVKPRPTSQSSSGISVMVWILLAVAMGIVLIALFSNKKELPEETPVQKLPATEISDPSQNHVEPPVSKPEPAPTPVPEPAPTPVPVPEPTPVPEPVPEPVLLPEPEISTTPKFDVAGFYDRARKVMLDKVTPLLTARDKELIRNVYSLKKDCRRLVREIEDDEKQKHVEKLMRSFMDECEKNKVRIPKELDNRFRDIAGLKEILQQHLEMEASIDKKLVSDVSELSAIYMVGLQKQIDRLLADKDSAAAKLLEDEVAKVSEDVKYFPGLMLEGDPSVKEPELKEGKLNP